MPKKLESCIEKVNKKNSVKPKNKRVNAYGVCKASIKRKKKK